MTSPASANFPWPQVPEPAAGEIRRGELRWPEAVLRDVSLPYIAARGNRPGPSVLIMATGKQSGYAAVHGLLQLAGVLDSHRLSGSLLLLPMVAPAEAELPSNVFMHDLLEPADACIELTAGSSTLGCVEHSAYFRIEGDDLGEAIAMHFDVQYAVAERTQAEPTSDSLPTVALQGKPVVRVIIPDDQSRRDQQVETVFVGLANALRQLGALEGQVSDTTCQLMRRVGGALAPVSGLWKPEVRIGQRVRSDDPLGSLLDRTGKELGRLIASETGIVLCCSHQVLVNEGDVLIQLIRSFD